MCLAGRNRNVPVSLGNHCGIVVPASSVVILYFPSTELTESKAQSFSSVAMLPTQNNRALRTMHTSASERCLLSVATAVNHRHA